MTSSGGLAVRLRSAVGAREGEGAVLLWSTAYYFLVLCAYYVIRPIRDEIGAASGAENLAWLFTGTLAGMLLVHPLYTALVSRLTRRRFVSWAYRFFVLNLVAFYFVFRAADPAEAVWAGRVFFIWTSVFNLFVVSVFWSLITDVFRPGQGKRLFGVVAVGGTLGAMLGATITTLLIDVMGPMNLMLVSALIIELAVRASQVLDRHEGAMRAAALDEGEAVAATSTRDASKEVIGGGVMDGIRHVFSSPYLFGIALLILFYTISSTFLYFQQADIVARVFKDNPAERTRVFGMMDIAVNGLTLVGQLFLTGRVMKWLGVGVALAFLPVLTLIGFSVLGAAPVLAVLVVFQVARRAGNFAIQRPAREALFTVVPRTDKYKAKNFTDTFVYRFGDQVGAWSYTAMAVFGLGASGLAFTMVPFSALWVILTVWLGRRYMKLERGERTASPSPAVATPAAGG
ncbi:MAG: MFS transporter [Gemmatimonadaceae bacterium]|nr:MFS transporter [Gemmatimonadaceae bacterium]